MQSEVIIIIWTKVIGRSGLIVLKPTFYQGITKCSSILSQHKGEVELRSLLADGATYVGIPRLDFY